MSRKKTIFKIIIPLIIILLGFGIMMILKWSRPEPKKVIKENPGILVKTLKVKKQDTELSITGTGTVKAAHEVSIIPQVSGRVTYVSPNLVVGGLFRKNEILFEIEAADYQLALERAKAAKAKAEFELATIESQARIAREEWKRLHGKNGTPPNPLVIYEPQLKNAQAALASASAALEQGRLDLKRTKVRAPFNSRVRSENIDPGQYVRTSTSAAVLAGTDTAEIYVPLSLEDLHWLDIPKQGEFRKGSAAAVYVNTNSKQYTWYGQAVRSTGEVDPKSRMMQVVVEIKDPYGIITNNNRVYPSLAIETFVNISLKGKKLKNIFIIPRPAFREDSTVWLMDRVNKLQIQKVQAVRIEKDKVIINEGLNDGDLIVLSNISGAADGMKLRTIKINDKFQIPNSK